MKRINVIPSSTKRLHHKLAIATASTVALFASQALMADDWQKEGQLTLELRQFAEPNMDRQFNNDSSLSGEIKISKEWNDGYDEFVAIPSFRVNNRDSGQNRIDFKSLSWNHQADTWALRTGVRTVTWQVTESRHLVDVINQIDASADIDGEDKLGEAMVNAVKLTDWGNMELLVMPGFRERVLPGEHARLRSPVPFDTKGADYESGAAEWRTDVAAKVTWIPDDWELALSHFSGTSREPVYNFVNGTLRPEYRLIDQTGLEVQYAAGNWLWKGEAISNSGFERKRYSAAVAGFEYTWSGLGETGYDVGVLSEYLWDERKFSPLREDIFVGARLSLNDIPGTTLLIGAITDLKTEEYIGLAEFSRRVGNNLKLDVEVRLFGKPGNTGQSDFNLLHKDDYINVILTRYY